MKKILIVGHGKFASGIEAAINMINGSHPDLFSIDFSEEDSDDTLNEKISSVISDNMANDFLIISDLPGGTPFNVSVRIANCNHKIKVVAGVNLGSILEILNIKEGFSIEELAKNIVDTSKRYTMYFEEGNLSTAKDIIDDGI